ncbi:MAG: tripartite tricarboxylate transporter TctB family protein [Alphaproteobacteria bacterium]|jgi:hypothetical protein
MTPGAEADGGGSRRVDVAAGALLMVVAGGFLAAAWREPAALYDPLGPGTAPMGVAGLLFCLAALLMLRALLGRRVGQSGQRLILGLEASGTTEYRLRPGLALACFLATCGFAASIALGLPFLWSAMAFLAGLGCALADFRPRPSAWAMGVGVAGALALDHLFRRVLLVNLP